MNGMNLRSCSRLSFSACVGTGGSKGRERRRLAGVYQTLPSPLPGVGQPHFSSRTCWDARPHTSLRASLPTVCLCLGPLALGGRWDAWGPHAAAACTSTQKQGPR